MEMPIYTQQKTEQKKRLSRNVAVTTSLLVVLAVALLGYYAYGQLFPKWQAQTTSKVKGAQVCSGFDATQKRILSSKNVKKWILIGSEFKAEDKLLIVEAVLDTSLEKLSKEDGFTVHLNVVNTELSAKMSLVEDGIMKNGKKASGLLYRGSAEVEGLGAGNFAVVTKVTTPCGEETSAPTAFNISYPMYVAWTIDWEGSDVKQQYLNDMSLLSRKHNIPMTHFFNPRIYVTKAVSAARAQQLTAWVKNMRDKYGHQIGLHLHMFPDMVAATGVTPRTSPAFGWGRTDGYDILLTGYSQAEVQKMLAWAKATLVAKGLGTPTVFRAGGWFANESTLRALQNAGFTVDSSGRTKFQIGTNGYYVPWNLSVTTQPYRPNTTDQNSSDAPNMNIWEFPNNGGDSWFFSKAQLLERFRAHYTSGVLKEKKLITYLSHPDWFYKDKPTMDGLLNYTDKFLYTRDAGPVVYITLKGAYQAWTGTK